RSCQPPSLASSYFSATNQFEVSKSRSPGTAMGNSLHLHPRRIAARTGRYHELVYANAPKPQVVARIFRNDVIEIASGKRGQRDRYRLPSFRCLDDPKRHLLALGQVVKSGPLQNRNVDEDVFLAVIGTDKTEPFFGIEPLHGPMDFNGRGGINGVAHAAWCRRSVAARPFGGSTAFVDLEDARDLQSFRPRSDMSMQLGAPQHRFAARRLQHRYMQKSIAGAVAHRYEAEALFGIEPFDDRFGGRALDR